LTDTLIYKYSDTEGRWGKYFLRKNGTIRYENSNGGYANKVTPDGLIGIIKLKAWSGKVFINVDALKKATSIQWI